MSGESLWHLKVASFRQEAIGSIEKNKLLKAWTMTKKIQRFVVTLKLKVER